MTALIPHVTSVSGARFVSDFYADSKFARIPLEKAGKYIPLLPDAAELWVDPCMDGCDDVSKRTGKPGSPNKWFEFMKKLCNFADFSDSDFIEKPNQLRVYDFVEDILGKCLECNPSWITVPQLPLVDDASRNKINRALAKATGKWMSTSKFKGRMILPLIVTNQNQIKNKTVRNPKVSQAQKCYHESQADGFWVVDSSLDDESGSKLLREKRFSYVIDLHEELNAKIPSKIRIAGPYWGLNLVLWVKGLIDFPLIGLGSGYQYHLCGSPHGSPPVARIALPSLRRRARVRPSLNAWLRRTVSKLDSANPVHTEMSDLLHRFTALHDDTRSRRQVARFYRDWYDEIASAPAGGLGMAMFQDLATAYAFGKPLENLVDEEAARRPETIVEPLMMNCL